MLSCCKFHHVDKWCLGEFESVFLGINGFKKAPAFFSICGEGGSGFDLSKEEYHKDEKFEGIKCFD